jgi:succinyl-CoA synthetase alpha subunit
MQGVGESEALAVRIEVALVIMIGEIGGSAEEDAAQSWNGQAHLASA